MELPKHYNPREQEEKWLDHWKEQGVFSPNSSDEGPRYSIVIPPPNVTDILHLGHALNNVIQDVLIRYKRMRGFNTLWLPGTDHAGIATQNVLEKRLANEGKTKEDIGRKAFFDLAWQWKEEKGGTILEQLRQIGSSCDFTRTRFTMDEGFSNAVKETFIRLHEQGLIYTGDYIINWCPRCRTALSDDEVEHQDEAGKLWYIRYPLEDDRAKFITVATTRPETMLGDTGVAVNPEDPRFADLVGKNVILPIMNKPIPVVADYHVDPEFGTGCVKITPAHDPNDFEVGLRHDLPRVLAIEEDGTMAKMAGEYAGMDRFEARNKIIESLDKQGLLEKIEDHAHAVGHCYRCDTTIEPYLSNQWFVRMKPLAEPALALVRRGKVRIHPKRWEGVYFNWMENIRDWCISRQLWWGHRMPVYWCNDCGKYTVARQMPESCPHCEGGRLRQDENVLDTWFSSWLWPFATMGWPDINSDDLKAFFPTNTLSTANEIIFFWVARMIMASVHFMGELPFEDVYIHGTVRDNQGRKMSKSLGNGIDPLKVIDEYGRDALRFTMLFQAAAGQDIYLSIESFEEGRNFTNKLWNAARLLLSNIDGSWSLEDLRSARPVEPEDRFILSQLSQTVEKVEKAVDAFNLADGIKTLYGFFWNDFCSWYLEMIKPRLFDKKAGDPVSEIALRVLVDILHMLQPFTPFVAEELFGILRDNGILKTDITSITVAPFPPIQQENRDNDADRLFDVFREIVSQTRNFKAEIGLANQKKGDLNLIAPKDKQEYLKAIDDDLMRLARLEGVSFIDKKPDVACKAAVVTDIEVYLPLGDLVDIDKEIEKIDKEIARIEGQVKGTEKKLQNPQFTDRAPEHVVERERQKMRDMTDKLDKLRSQKKSFE